MLFNAADGIIGRLSKCVRILFRYIFVIYTFPARYKNIKSAYNTTTVRKYRFIIHTLDGDKIVCTKIQ